MKTALTLSLLLTLSPLPGWAGGGGMSGGATEVTQIMNNTELLLQTIEEYTQTANLIEQTMLQKLQQAQKDLGMNNALLGGLVEQYQTAQKIRKNLDHLKGKAENFEQRLEDRVRAMAASSLDWKGYVERERRLIQSGNALAKQMLAADLAAAEQTRQSLKAYEQAAKDAEQSLGVHQATQLLNAQLAVVGQDLNRVISSLQDANVMAAEAALERAADREAAAQQGEQIREAQKRINTMNRHELDRIKGGVR